MASQRGKPKVPKDCNGAKAFYHASYQNAQNRGELPSVFLPRPFDFTSTVPPPDTNVPLCSNCGGPRDTKYAPGYYSFVSMNCGHSFCTKCIVFTMPGEKTCIAADCDEPIPDVTQYNLKAQRRRWEIDNAVEIAKEKRLIRLPDTAIQPNYEQAAAYLLQEPAAPDNRAVHIDIDHLNPHLLGLANLLPIIRRLELQQPLDPKRWIQIVNGIDKLLEKLKGGKKYCSGTMLYDFLKKNTDHWLDKKPHGETATEIERHSADLLMRFVVQIAQEGSLWNQSRIAAREKSTQSRARLIQVMDVVDPYLEGVKEVSEQSVASVCETSRRSVAAVKQMSSSIKSRFSSG